ncbi:TrgA family protein [Yoonia sp. F2084L]|uniref:TrgA family protein n=1 Tax=Yoonia sp. F2084L TaxID=2926419 RepID=UPI001FF19809|nr:TrgA family protein [Yoonia sp. F2084L]MCK0094588.1 TrgA family protein [Yoonia sp. F2084L]
MPTAGRLAGAVIFALFGWYLGGISVELFPEANAPDFWLPANAFIGLIIGWKICGSRAGNGYNAAMGVGLTCAFALGFCALFVVAFNQMISNAMRLRYDGPMDAIVGIFSLMLEFAVYFYDFTLIATLLVGSVICAWFTEFFGQRYP